MGATIIFAGDVPGWCFPRSADVAVLMESQWFPALGGIHNRFVDLNPGPDALGGELPISCMASVFACWRQQDKEPNRLMYLGSSAYHDSPAPNWELGSQDHMENTHLGSKACSGRSEAYSL